MQPRLRPAKAQDKTLGNASWFSPASLDITEAATAPRGCLPSPQQVRPSPPCLPEPLVSGLVWATEKAQTVPWKCRSEALGFLLGGGFVAGECLEFVSDLAAPNSTVSRLPRQ